MNERLAELSGKNTIATRKFRVPLSRFTLHLARRLFLIFWLFVYPRRYIPLSDTYDGLFLIAFNPTIEPWIAMRLDNMRAASMGLRSCSRAHLHSHSHSHPQSHTQSHPHSVLPSISAEGIDAVDTAVDVVALSGLQGRRGKPGLRIDPTLGALGSWQLASPSFTRSTGREGWLDRTKRGVAGIGGGCDAVDFGREERMAAAAYALHAQVWAILDNEVESFEKRLTMNPTLHRASTDSSRFPFHFPSPSSPFLPVRHGRHVIAPTSSHRSLSTSSRFLAHAMTEAELMERNGGHDFDHDFEYDYEYTPLPREVQEAHARRAGRAGQGGRGRGQGAGDVPCIGDNAEGVVDGSVGRVRRDRGQSPTYDMRRRGTDEVELSRLAARFAPFTEPRPPIGTPGPSNLQSSPRPSRSAYQRDYVPLDEDLDQLAEDASSHQSDIHEYEDYEYDPHQPLPPPPVLSNPEEVMAPIKKRRRRRDRANALPPLPAGEAISDDDARYDWREVAPSRSVHAKRGKKWFPDKHVDRVKTGKVKLGEDDQFGAEVMKYTNQ